MVRERREEKCFAHMKNEIITGKVVDPEIVFAGVAANGLTCYY
jgi:hypothetical protein